MEKLNITTTNRGFAYAEFTDRYGEKCSLQKSSLAFEDCIWLGVHDQKVKKCVQNEGWVDVPLPEGHSIFGGRMHLTQDMVKALLPALKHFAKTGELPEPTESQ